MKSTIIGIFILALLAVVLSIQPQGDMYQGYTQLVSKYVKSNEPKRAHDLDLSKYRPDFPSH